MAYFPLALGLYLLSHHFEIKGAIEIIFKPHPLLKVKLYNDSEWGIEKTNEYYNKWKNHNYGGLNESEYINLFKTSDALIHDSGSFLIEYLYLNKPVLRTDKDDSIKERLNSFGKMAYDVHYIAKNKNEIIEFIDHVIFKERDKLINKRLELKNTYLIPPNNKSASQNIFNYIKSCSV
jgi:CDP-glycerol glycerophosphotransferase (TagB/SpsB family)